MKYLAQPFLSKRGLLPIAGAALIACSAPAGDQDQGQSEATGSAAMSGDRMAMMTDRPMMRSGMMSGGMMSDGMMSGGMMGGGMADMRNIHGLLASHEAIERQVVDLPDGVRTITTSNDPEVAQMIRAHVRQMRDRYERDQPIRAMDPLFRELFENRDKAKMEIRDVPGGVEVVHTSSDPKVVALIRQHARHFVSRVVERGMPAAMGPTPLPEGY